MVLPLTARVSKNGHLEIGGCDTVSLAKKFGTPLFVMDEFTIRRKCQKYRQAFEERSQNVEIIYASKAFMSLAISQLIKQEGLSIDVSSGGELYIAIQSGFPTDKIYLHGNNKMPDELRLALDSGVSRIVVDSFNELELLGKLAREGKKQVDILLRITPGIEAHTHDYVQTGGEDSKFGFGLAEGVALEAIKEAIDVPNLNLRGIHAHIGSQIFALHSYAKAIKLIMGFIKEVKDKTGYLVEEFNVGGGLGIKYEATDEPSTIEEYAETIVGGIQKESEAQGLPVPKIMIEPGRSLVGNAGVTLYTIGTIKEIPKVRTYVSVDGGMSDNLRPMLYGAVYEALIANKADVKPVKTVTVAGKHCESGDVLIKDVCLPSPEVGDILCTPATGAYGYVMANNYNKQTRPAVVLVKDGQASLIVRRETYEDLLRLERPLT